MSNRYSLEIPEDIQPYVKQLYDEGMSYAKIHGRIYRAGYEVLTKDDVQELQQPGKHYLEITPEMLTTAKSLVSSDIDADAKLRECIQIGFTKLQTTAELEHVEHATRKQVLVERIQQEAQPALSEVTMTPALETETETTPEPEPKTGKVKWTNPFARVMKPKTH